MISPAMSPPITAPGERAHAADHDHDEGLHQDHLAHLGRERHHGRVDDAGEARGHGADAEDDHEDALHVDAEGIDHHRVLDAGAHDHAQARAIEDEEERHQRDRADAHHGEAVGRVDHEAQVGDAREDRRRRHRLRLAREEVAHRLDENDGEAEGDEQLVLGRARIEMPDHQALHDDAHEGQQRQRCRR